MIRYPFLNLLRFNWYIIIQYINDFCFIYTFNFIKDSKLKVKEVWINDQGIYDLKIRKKILNEYFLILLVSK